LKSQDCQASVPAVTVLKLIHARANSRFVFSTSNSYDAGKSLIKEANQMKRLFLAFGVLSVTLALGSGCTTTTHSLEPVSMNAPAPAASPSQPQATPPPEAPSVYTPPVAVTPSTTGAATEQNEVVQFKIKAPDAANVYLAGEFNSWSETDTPMTKQPNGEWTASVALAPGSYQYKFIVDGTWTPDPDNPNQTDDGYGGSNSVIQVSEHAKAP
jgi:Glycogen recognition site of AMP-activated protein kinase